MKILVFDMCFNKSYIILEDNSNIIANEVIESTSSNYHSVFVIPKIRNILKSNNILMKDIDVFGVNIGPGSFTGIRTAITIARVFAQQYEKKLVGVSSLSILSKLNDTDKDTIVALDARKNKVYYSYFSKNNILANPILIEKEELLNRINNDCIVITDSSIHSFLSESAIKSINYEENDSALGLYLLSITKELLSNNTNDFNWAKIKPEYIQPPSITKPKEIKYV